MFAECAGRYSAITEFLWLWDGPASEEAARRRDQFALLVDVTLPDTSGTLATQAMGHRIATKAAHRAVLDLRAYSQNAGPDLATLSQVPQCDKLLLSQ